MPVHLKFCNSSSGCSGIATGMQWQTDYGLPWRLIFITALARGVPTGHPQPHFFTLTGWPLAARPERQCPSATPPTPATQSVPQAAGFQRRRCRTRLGCRDSRRRRRCYCCRRCRRRGWRGRRLRRTVGVGVGVGVGVTFAKYSISSSGKERLEFLVGLISVVFVMSRLAESIKRPI
jgi:hypothetical protein